MSEAGRIATRRTLLIAEAVVIMATFVALIGIVGFAIKERIYWVLIAPVCLSAFVLLFAFAWATSWRNVQKEKKLLETGGADALAAFRAANPWVLKKGERRK